MLSHDVETEIVATPWSRAGSDRICRTGSLAEGWSSGSAQTRTAVFLLSSSTSSGMSLLLSFPFLPLHHLLTFIKSSFFLGFFTSTSPQNSHPCPVDVLVWDRRNLLLPHSSVCRNRQSSQKNRAVLPQISCHVLEGAGVTKPHWQLAVVESSKLHSPKTTLPGKLYL